MFAVFDFLRQRDAISGVVEKTIFRVFRGGDLLVSVNNRALL